MSLQVIFHALRSNVLVANLTWLLLMRKLMP
jgi:hypothetical protein